jgi:hypothetical protein
MSHLKSVAPPTILANNANRQLSNLVIALFALTAQLISTQSTLLKQIRRVSLVKCGELAETKVRRMRYWNRAHLFLCQANRARQ